MSAIKTRPAASAAANANGSAAAAGPPPPPPRPLVVNSPLPLPVKGAPVASDADQAALWAEVGLEVNGVHNYDPRCIELSRSELEALHDEFLAHRKLFGFQADNVRNQMEHLCFLIQNARDRYGASAYQYLHNRSVAQARQSQQRQRQQPAFQFVCALLSPIAFVCVRPFLCVQLLLQLPPLVRAHQRAAMVLPEAHEALVRLALIRCEPAH